MNPWYLLVIPVAIALFFYILWRVRQEQQDSATIAGLWDKLNAEVLAVSLLVSKSCPDNTQAHTAVIQAAQCLVFPKVGAHTIVSASMIEARYKQGFEFLDQARKFAGGAKCAAVTESIASDAVPVKEEVSDGVLLGEVSDRAIVQARGNNGGFNENNLRELYRLAIREKRQESPGHNWAQTLKPHFHGGQQLYQLAKHTSSVDLLTDAEILPTFFTTKAIELLLTMANAYWFWTVVAEAVLDVDEKSQQTKIDFENVRRAIKGLRLGLQGVVQLSKDIEQLTIDETAYWIASGLIVVDVSNKQVTRRRNPVFYKPVPNQ